MTMGAPPATAPTDCAETPPAGDPGRRLRGLRPLAGNRSDHHPRCDDRDHRRERRWTVVIGYLIAWALMPVSGLRAAAAWAA